MKRAALLLAMFVAVPLSAQSATAANSGVSGVKGVWSIMSGYFTKAADQMPEADYAYKPVASVRTFGELMAHVAGAQFSFCAAALGEPEKGEDDIEKTAKTKTAKAVKA